MYVEIYIDDIEASIQLPGHKSGCSYRTNPTHSQIRWRVVGCIFEITGPNPDEWYLNPLYLSHTLVVIQLFKHVFSKDSLQKNPETEDALLLLTGCCLLHFPSKSIAQNSVPKEFLY